MLVFTVFCCVSGGPYGLEPVVGEAGAGFGLLLILVIPFLWALPDALTTAEMAPMLPVEGGYIRWVQRALGPFAGFLNAWWTWLYNLVDAAIYPVLFATYLDSLLRLFGGPALSGTQQWAAGMAVIVFFGWLNIRGIRLVGLGSTVLAVLIMTPFAALVAAGLARAWAEGRPFEVGFLPEGKGLGGALAGGLAFVLWNYLGWDQLSTVAEEVQEPQRAYPLAILVGVPLVTLVYALPTWVSLHYVPDPAQWTDGAWPEIGRAVGGEWLGTWLAVAGILSPLALFSAVLLASSRIPNVMAEDGWAPRFLEQLHPRYGTPVNSILLHCAVYTVLSWKTFAELVALNVVLYASALFLEGLSLLVLRRREPDLPRPFKIRGGWPVLLSVWLLPTVLGLVLVGTTMTEVRDLAGFARELGPTVAAVVSGPALYGVIVWRRRRRGV
jgi:amino acid transporter